MIPRILEPEVMDTAEEAVDYNTMDHSQVNRVFVDDLLSALDGSRFKNDAENAKSSLTVLDVGTGTALIPIELCRRSDRFQLTAVDLARAMLDVARQNVESAGLSDRIALECLDAKGLPYRDEEFDVVMSNSILHHIPEPAACLAEMLRVVSPGGLLFVRDLMRPADSPELERLVTLYAGDANAHQRQMFRDSLHAALTVDEVRTQGVALGVGIKCVQQTSDRHWTLVWIR